jgi:hypothetical protein
MQISNNSTHSVKIVVTRSTGPSSDASWSSTATMLICLTAPHYILAQAIDLTRHERHIIVKIQSAYNGCTWLFRDAFDLSTSKCLSKHSQLTFWMLCSLFSSFGTDATSFLLKTSYSATEHVIYDITPLSRRPVDQQIAESKMMVCETTCNWCNLQEWCQ